MNKYKKSTILRVIIGTIVVMNGLIGVIFINDCVDFALDHFGNLFMNNNDFLMIIAVFLPFLQFLIGAFILCKICVKKSLTFALIISLMMIFFIVVGNLHYSRLIYHILIAGAALFLLALPKGLIPLGLPRN